jgi:uncharacterized protein YdaU (DUF1376 family)
MKDPAFPFYAQDFLVGTLHLSCQETGAFIKLLAYQWINLGIPKSRLGSILGLGWDSVWLCISDKFIEKDGVLFNERLEMEREKRAQYKQKQAENGKKGGRPRKEDLAINAVNATVATKTSKEIKPKNPTKTQKKPLENENERENENVIEIEKGKEGSGEKPDGANTTLVPVDCNAAGGEVVSPFASEDFAAQWQAWKRYRAAEHNFTYRSAESEQAALAELGTLAHTSETTAIAILHQSMGKGWKGFFELKQDATKPAAGKGKVRYSDDFRRKIANRLQSK